MCVHQMGPMKAAIGRIPHINQWSLRNNSDVTKCSSFWRQVNICIQLMIQALVKSEIHIWILF